jgi:hypothetical protein
MTTEEIEEADDAARAFEDLRAEVSVLRRAVEQLPAAWAANQAPDYTPSLAAITQGLEEVTLQLEDMEDHPALSLTPAQHVQAIAHAGSEVMNGAVRRLDEATRSAQLQAQLLASMIGVTRTQDQQIKWLVITGVATLVLGLVTSPFFAGLLPFGWNGRVAATIMHTDRWRAGETLMRSDDPLSWTSVQAMVDLGKANKDALAACREAAAKSKKEQHCSLVVPAAQ